MRPRVVSLLFVLGVAVSAEAQSPCAERIAALGQACLLYAEQHEGAMPAALSDLYYEAYLFGLEAFVCPDRAVPIEDRERIDVLAGYALCPEARGAGLRPIVQDLSPRNHAGRGVHVFMSDGSVRFVPAEDEAPTSTEVFAPLGGAVLLGLRVLPLEAPDPRLASLPIARGLLVVAVQSGSLAARWDLRPGDVLSALDGEVLDAAGALSARLAGSRPEDRRSLLLFRDARAAVRIVVPGDLRAILGGAAGEQEAAGSEPTIRELGVAPRCAAVSPEIRGRIVYGGAAPGTQLLLEWFRGEESMGRCLAALGSAGSLDVSLLDLRGTGFPPGAWRLTARARGRNLATARFAVE